MRPNADFIECCNNSYYYKYTKVKQLCKRLLVKSKKWCKLSFGRDWFSNDMQVRSTLGQR